MASLAPAYLPRRPQETVLYDLVRGNLETFLAHARANYEGGLPRYVERELRAYLACGDFSRGFMRAHCDACGHDLLIAFSCGSRSICPSCTGRRMANTAAFLVDRVLPNVPLRQYVLTMPDELRRLVAFRADVLTAIARIFVESVFALYRGRAKRDGIEAPQCGAVNFVQRCGSSINLHVHYHLVVLDGVFARDAEGPLVFHPAHAPTPAELDAIVARTARRSNGWLRRHGYVDDAPLEARSNEPPEQTALEACGGARSCPRRASGPTHVRLHLRRSPRRRPGRGELRRDGEPSTRHEDWPRIVLGRDRRPDSSRHRSQDGASPGRLPRAVPKPLHRSIDVGASARSLQSPTSVPNFDSASAASRQDGENRGLAGVVDAGGR